MTRRRAGRQLAAGITGSLATLGWLGTHLDLTALQTLAPLTP